jgi:hypothetical protein
MYAIAQTNLQLYNELRAQGRTVADVILVRRAYEFAMHAYSGYYQGDGRPFIAHCVGVASVLAELESPATLVAAGMLHNAYGNADFGDGARESTSDGRREAVRRAVGPEVEALLYRFRTSRIDEHTLPGILERLPAMDAIEKQLLLIDLADMVDKHADNAVEYFGEPDWLVEEDGRIGADVVEIARRLDQPRLAAMLTEAFESSRNAASDRDLRASDGRRYMALIVPPSCWPAPGTLLRAGVGHARSSLATVPGLRALKSRLAGKPAASNGSDAQSS